MINSDTNTYLCFLYQIGFSQKKLSFVLKEGLCPKEIFENLGNHTDYFKFSDEKIQTLFHRKQELKTHALLATIQKHDIQIVSLQDEHYPSLLSHLPNCPAIIFTQGTLPDSEKLVSIV